MSFHNKQELGAITAAMLDLTNPINVFRHEKGVTYGLCVLADMSIRFGRRDLTTSLHCLSAGGTDAEELHLGKICVCSEETACRKK